MPNDGQYHDPLNLIATLALEKEWLGGLDMTQEKHQTGSGRVNREGIAGEPCSPREFHVTASDGVGFLGLTHIEERTYTSVNTRFDYEPWVVNDWLIGET